MTDLRRLTKGPERISPESMKPVKCFANIIDFNNVNEPTRVGGTSGDGIGDTVGSGATRRTSHELVKLPPGIMFMGGQLEVTTAWENAGTNPSGLSLWIGDTQITGAVANTAGTIVNTLGAGFIRDTDTSAAGVQTPQLRFAGSEVVTLGLHQTSTTAPTSYTAGEIVVVLQFVEYRRRDECGNFEVRTRATDPSYFADR